MLREELGDLARGGGREVGARGPLLDGVPPRERAKIVEAVGVGGRLGVDPALVEEDARDPERKEAVGARADRVVPVADLQGAGVVHGVDLDDGDAAGPGALEVGQQVDARLGYVLPPQHDGPAVIEVVEVVRVGDAHVRDLRRLARAGADVAALVRDRAEQLEEVAVQELQDAERSAALVVQDRRRPVAISRLCDLLGHEVERLVPPGLDERAALAHEGCREALLRVLALEVMVGPVAEEAARDGVLGVAAEARDAAAFDGGEESGRRRGSRGCRRCGSRRPWPVTVASGARFGYPWSETDGDARPIAEGDSNEPGRLRRRRRTRRRRLGPAPGGSASGRVRSSSGRASWRWLRRPAAGRLRSASWGRLWRSSSRRASWRRLRWPSAGRSSGLRPAARGAEPLHAAGRRR